MKQSLEWFWRWLFGRDKAKHQGWVIGYPFLWDWEPDRLLGDPRKHGKHRWPLTNGG